MTVKELKERLENADENDIVEVFAAGEIYEVEDISYIYGRASGKDEAGMAVRDENSYSLDCGWNPVRQQT